MLLEDGIVIFLFCYCFVIVLLLLLLLLLSSFPFKNYACRISKMTSWSDYYNGIG